MLEYNSPMPVTPPPPLVDNFLHSNFISVQIETLNFRIQSLENVIKYI